ncbi:MAG: PAS domain-containing protein, partial [Asticcacaulis sp.]
MLFKPVVSTDYQAVMAALNLSQAVIEFTPAGLILTANANFLAVVGYELPEIVGRHHRLFCDPADAESEAYQTFWHDLSQGKFASDTFRRIGKGGKNIWLQATYNPVRDKSGKVTKVIKFASDITAQRQQDIDYSGKIMAIDRAQAVIEFTPTGHILTANDNFLKTVGYTLDEIAGQHHAIFCDPDYVASKAYQDFWAGLARGEYQSAEYRRLGKNGREV